MIDAALTVVDAINADAEMSSQLSGGVYAYRIPQNASPPLALVLVPATYPAAPPTSTWWMHMVSVDLHSETPQGALQLADTFRNLAPKIFGDTSGGVVADCQVESISALTDGSWTPTRYRQIVTVSLTAREP